jgi:D-alanine-D-alanine ligase
VRITVLTSRVEVDGHPYDPVADRIAKALKAGGHTASVLAVDSDVRKLVAGLARRKPDLVFNVLEEFGDTLWGAVGVAGLLEILGYAYTGGGPGELYVRQDKALAKKLLRFERIPTPDFAVFSLDADLETGGNLRLPLFVKPLRLDASYGIDAKSLVTTSTELLARVKRIHTQVGDSALAEEFVDGREFYVGVLGNTDPVVFPPIEADFSGLPEGKPRIMDGKAKWDERSAEYKGTESKLAEELPAELVARLQKVAVEAYRACRVRDYGRVDLRLAGTGDIYVIEVNASCYLEPTGEFATAAKAAGFEYDRLVNRIAELAVARQPKAAR